MIDAEKAWGKKDAKRARDLCDAPAAELARDVCGEDNARSAGEDGKNADGQERIAKEVALEPGRDGNQRRLIDVTPGKMASAVEIVKLIDEEAVAPAGVEMDGDLDESDEKNSKPRTEQPGPRGCGGECDGLPGCGFHVESSRVEFIKRRIRKEQCSGSAETD